MSEVTKTKGNHAVMVTDMQTAMNKRKMLFILRSSKTHGKHTHPQFIKISTKVMGNEQRNDKHNCPYQILEEYVAARPPYESIQEQFFVFRDYSPVTGFQMRSTLHKLLNLMQYQASNYNCHSFRQGRSVDLLKYGVPVPIIQKLGRWTSNCVYTYLRAYT